MSTRKMMRVAVYYSRQDVRVEEWPIPQIGPGELLVKTEACGLCGGETMEWYVGPRAPKVLGHEPTGVVVQVGQGVTRFKEGDRVFVHHHVACMSCHFCHRGQYTLCEHYNKTGIDPGGFAEYIRVPEENVRLDTHILPEGVSFEEGTVVEPLACVVRGMETIVVHPGDTLAVLGAGFMGMCFVQLARLYPLARIVALDFSDWRLDKARALGATHTINPRTQDAPAALRELNEGRLADIVVLTVPSASAWQSALALCEKGAILHSNAPAAPDESVCLKPNELYFRQITLNSAFSASQANTRAALDLVASKRIDAQAMITHRFGLDGVGAAIQLLLRAGASLKSVIIPGK